MIMPNPFVEIGGRIYNVMYWSEVELKSLIIPNLPEQYKIMVRIGEREWIEIKTFSQKDRADKFYRMLKTFLGAKPM